MIYLLLDFIISYFSKYPTYFILLNLIMIPKEKLIKLIIITLVLDLLILNSYFLNTIILMIIFLGYKKLHIIKVNLKNYIISLSLIFVLYLLAIGLLKHYSLNYLGIFIINNYIVNIILYLLCYKIIKKNIKLAR